MRKVLFIGMLKLNFKREAESFFHLRKKYEGLSQHVKPYILGRGKPFYTNIWGAEFYLLPEIFFFWPLAFLVAFYLCLSKKIEVIIAQSPLMAGWVGTILKVLLRKELIVEMHGDWKEGPFLSKKRRFEPFQKKAVPILAKISFKNADKIRGVADYLIEAAKKIAPGKKYFLFPTFTDLSLFLEEKNVKYENFILSVGQLEQVKGMNILIEAFHKIEKEFPNFKLIIIGEGSEEKNLQLLTSDFKLKDKVEFKGKLSLEETKNIMKRCYCFVLSSFSEGLPRVLMEAMALEKPMVASNVGGIPALIKEGENGFLFKVGDSDELAKNLRILLKNPNLAIKMGKTGKSFIRENFSNEKYIENYISLINA
ncbi:MAG: glycosyltransferase family 4 protein [Candidatus Paceibacterales bacterium]